MAKSSRIAVRLEGGIGDHLLGMRILRFVRERFPGHEIIVYSDAQGGEAQLAVAQLSPDADRVVPVRLRAPPAAIEAMGRLENLDPDMLSEMRSADLFLDTWGNGFFLAESRQLAIPFYEILAARPRLTLPKAACWEAAQLLACWPEARFLVVNLTKHGPNWLDHALGGLRPMVEELLADPRVVVLAPVSTRFSFAHWPAAERAVRESMAAAELGNVWSMAGWHERIAILPDLPIAVVAALLKQASYFVGVDNGIKHLAWALHVPRTVLMPTMPEALFAMRWCPDLHRILPLDTSADMLAAHLAEARAALTEEDSAVIQLPHLFGIEDIERVREWTTYGNHSFGLLLYSLAHARCSTLRPAEVAAGAQQPRRIVEIGYFIGYSALMLTAALADSGAPGRVVSVDILDQEAGRYFMGIQPQLRELHELVVGDSVAVADTVRERVGGPIDLLLIDGDHTYEGCRRDVAAYAPLLAEDALLLLHDNYEPGVRRVIDEMQSWTFADVGGWAGLTVGTRSRY